MDSESIAYVSSRAIDSEVMRAIGIIIIDLLKSN